MTAAEPSRQPIAARSPSATLADAWLLQARWSQAASAAKQLYVRWNSVAVGMTVLAAFLGTLTSHIAEDPWRRSLAGLSAVLVAVVAVVGRLKTGPVNLREWLRSRSASEGLKTEVYQYATRTGPYARGDATARLSQRTDDIVSAVSDLNRLVAGVDVQPAQLPPDPMSVDHYLATRVEGQIGKYYEPRAASEARLVKRYRQAELLLAIAGAVLAGLACVGSESKLAPWSAVVTTALASLAAHLAAGRHEYQVTTYTATVLQLRRLSSRFRDERRTPDEPADVDRLVTECEAAISVENQGWMAQWQKEKSEGSSK